MGWVRGRLGWVRGRLGRDGVGEREVEKDGVGERMGRRWKGGQMESDER
jgi:hypothetical protein